MSRWTNAGSEREGADYVLRSRLTGPEKEEASETVINSGGLRSARRVEGPDVSSAGGGFVRRVIHG